MELSATHFFAAYCIVIFIGTCYYFYRLWHFHRIGAPAGHPPPVAIFTRYNAYSAGGYLISAVYFQEAEWSWEWLTLSFVWLLSIYVEFIQIRGRWLLRKSSWGLVAPVTPKRPIDNLREDIQKKQAALRKEYGELKVSSPPKTLKERLDGLYAEWQNLREPADILTVQIFSKAIEATVCGGFIGHAQPKRLDDELSKLFDINDWQRDDGKLVDDAFQAIATRTLLTLKPTKTKNIGGFRSCRDIHSRQVESEELKSSGGDVSIFSHNNFDGFFFVRYKSEHAGSWESFSVHLFLNRGLSSSVSDNIRDEICARFAGGKDEDWTNDIGRFVALKRRVGGRDFEETRINVFEPSEFSLNWYSKLGYQIYSLHISIEFHSIMA